eukprot:jgi/Galph1/5201/GphlegSOOS_G3844.1
MLPSSFIPSLNYPLTHFKRHKVIGYQLLPVASLSKQRASTRCCSHTTNFHKQVPVFYSDKCQLHRPPKSYGHHLECPERVQVALKRLRESTIASDILFFPFEQVKEQWIMDNILRVHSKGYVDELQRLIDKGVNSLDADTYLVSESFQIAKLAVQAWLQATKYTFEHSVPSFVLARPPGHHATPYSGMGFCLLSNVAIAATFAMEELSVSRIGIIDWDVHHGNGTAACFRKNPNVRFVSLHQFPFYPMTGDPVDHGPLHNLLNIAFEQGASGQEFVKRLKEEAIPFLIEHSPDMIFISAGYDALKMDPLGGLSLMPEDYYEMTKILMESFGHQNMVFGLEGGYHLETTAMAIEKTLEAMVTKCLWNKECHSKEDHTIGEMKDWQRKE